MTNPLLNISANARPLALALAAAAVLVGGFIIGRVGPPSLAKAIEAAEDQQSLSQVLQHWDPDGVRRVLRNLVVDTLLFLPGYVTFAGLLFVMIGTKATEPRGRAIVAACSWAPYIVGLVDLLENAALAMLVRFGYSGIGMHLARIATTTKWASVLLTALCLVSSILLVVLQR